MSLTVNLIGQRSRDVIGRLSVSHDVIGCCHWLLFISGHVTLGNDSCNLCCNKIVRKAARKIA